jgi:Yip1 domain
MTVDVDAPAAPTPPAKPSGIARIIGTLVSPGATLADIARRPTFVVPLILIVVLSIAGGAIMATKVDFAAIAHDAIEQNARAAQMSPEQKAQQVKLMGAIFRVSAFLAPVFSIVMLVVVAAILLAAFKLMGGDGDFLQAFSLTCYAWIPLLVKSVLVCVVVLARTRAFTMAQLQNPIASNLGFLVSLKEHPVLFSFLSSIDLFTIWLLVLLTIGFAAMSRFSRAKSAAIILALWVVKVFFTVAFASIGALMGHRA